MKPDHLLMAVVSLGIALCIWIIGYWVNHLIHEDICLDRGYNNARTTASYKGYCHSVIEHRDVVVPIEETKK